MKLAACFYTWGDWELLRYAVGNIAPVVDDIIIVYSEFSNYGEPDVHRSFTKRLIEQAGQGKAKLYLHNPVLSNPMHAETAKRNYGLDLARQSGASHYLCLDADELYEWSDIEYCKDLFEENHNLIGLVCDSIVYFSNPELTIGLDNTLIPFIHKITPTLKHEFNKQYPFAWQGLNIKIDPTRSFNIKDGIERTNITCHHYSWVRRDQDAYKRKIRNSTARANLERSNILQDLVNAKEGYFCEFYQKHLVRVPNRFNIPYGELLDEDIQPRTSTDA